ncbi:E3 ubiquitin-protein ligase SIAH1-like [Harmonia axyridis]|uniref:E3 ubiquitin-protein ligase SIAH1-like n=1 Tax=Harmonia axyridis TaxID=115357 RepID=UPI001E2781EC|nr:E3 ubiquitin-protein ligase SIAH1-like [Harmonia axyridis]
MNPVLSEFECPICLEYMMPPIHQCTMGHTFCVSCFDKLAICPTCRSPKGVSRAYALERIHSSVTFPCRYRFDGCDCQVKGLELSDHQDSCVYAKNSCPFSTPMSCKWQGKRRDILDHCKEAHPLNILRGNHIIMKCPMFDLLQQQEAFYFTIIQAFGELFQFCWYINDRGIMRWVVYFLGNSKDAKRYKYAIIIGKTQGPFDQISMIASCEPIVEENAMFDDKNCLTSTFDMVKKRNNNNGDLHYEIKLIDKPFEHVRVR